MSTADPSLREMFLQQREHYRKAGNATARERIGKLRALEKALSGKYRQPIRDALYADFKKPPLETDLTEIYPVLSEIRFVRRHLRDWMRDRRVPTPLPLAGSRSYIRYESKGVCLILSPWNFPLNLTFSPLVSALAAGNCCMVKPSEFAPATAALMREITAALFDPSEVCTVLGDATTAATLLELPFHHIFFTGSPRVGKIVMEAASRNLSSVTLELGGKSPVYIGESAALRTTARRIAWGKFSNAGQICVAPDYLLVAESAREELLHELRAATERFYPGGAAASDSYARIINRKHFDRLSNALDEAVAGGARILHGGGRDPGTLLFAPTLIDTMPSGCELLESEIFGPVLPIVTVKGPEEALEIINGRERPLALYVFSRDRGEIRKILEGTRAGSSAINHTVVQYGNHHLPFGGVNNSGIGKSHGHHGFLAFSNERAVLRQFTPGPVDFLNPPYTRLKQRLADLTLRWF